MGNASRSLARRTTPAERREKRAMGWTWGSVIARQERRAGSRGMRMVGSLALVLLLAGCGGGGWSKPGVGREKAAQDYSDCRHLAEIANQRDSNIDTDILASRGQDWERLGVRTLKRENYADSNRARSRDVVPRCMIGKGYTQAD